MSQIKNGNWKNVYEKKEEIDTISREKIELTYVKHELGTEIFKKRQVKQSVNYLEILNCIKLQPFRNFFEESNLQVKSF